MKDFGPRIMLIGPGGSGKSTLGKSLGEALNLPVLYLDKEFEHESDPAVRLCRIHEFAMGERWIIDGNMGVPNMDGRMARATSIVFLDFSRYRCLWRGLRRNIGQQLRREMRDDGCPARPDWTFMRWVWRFPNVQRPAILEKLSTYPDKAIILRNPRDVERLF